MDLSCATMWDVYCVSLGSVVQWVHIKPTSVSYERLFGNLSSNFQKIWAYIWYIYLSNFSTLMSFKNHYVKRIIKQMIKYTVFQAVYLYQLFKNYLMSHFLPIPLSKKMHDTSKSNSKLLNMYYAIGKVKEKEKKVFFMQFCNLDYQIL